MADATIKYTADAVIVTRDRRLRSRLLRILFGRNYGVRVLLIQRKWDPDEGKWALAGGHVDEDETGLRAVVRELEEEAGIRIDPSRFRSTGDGVFDDPRRDPRGRYVTVAFYAEVGPDTAATVVAGDDAAAVRWWPLDDLPDLAFDHSYVIDSVIADRRR